MKVDVFLAQHPMLYQMRKKRAAMADAEQNPFIDPDGYQRFVAAEEQRYLDQLQRESADDQS